MKYIFIISFLFFSFSKVEAYRAYITNEKDNTVSVIDINKKKSYRNGKGWTKTERHNYV